MPSVGGNFQLTLAILKPSVLKVPQVLREVQKEIVRNGFLVVRSKQTTISVTEAERFYSEHRNRFFYNRLVTFMSSGPCTVHVLARQNAVHEWRKLLGPTKVFQTQHTHPASIRGRFGLTDTRNAAHGSDSVESAEKEINFFFPEFDFSRWYNYEREAFQAGRVKFNSEEFIHIPELKDNS